MLPGTPPKPTQTRIYFCAICDEAILPHPDNPSVLEDMVFDEDGVYHVPCWTKRDEERLKPTPIGHLPGECEDADCWAHSED